MRHISDITYIYTLGVRFETHHPIWSHLMHYDEVNLIFLALVRGLQLLIDKLSDWTTSRTFDVRSLWRMYFIYGYSSLVLSSFLILVWLVLLNLNQIKPIYISIWVYSVWCIFDLARFGILFGFGLILIKTFWNFFCFNSVCFFFLLFN